MATQYQHGAWYDGKQWNANTQSFGAVGVINNPEQQGYGQAVSKEVNAQSAKAQGVSTDQFDSFLATQMQSPVNIPYSSGITNDFVTGLTAEVQTARKALEDTLKKQKEDNDLKLADLRTKEKETLDKVGELTTPFREELENAERERLYINENFEANQLLVRELETLLTEGNDLIRQQKEVTGLAAVRNPRIQKAMDDVAARAGVLEAVINVRNGQIAQAQNMIDRSVNAITADRQDRISYYETILNLNNRDILSLDGESKRIAQEQLDLVKGDLSRAQATADYVKQLMLNPATAGLMGQAGVKLTDSVETITAKLSTATYHNEVRDISNKMALDGATQVYDPSSVPPSQLVTLTDSRGQKLYFKAQPKAATATQSVNDALKILSGNTSINTGTTQEKAPGTFNGSVKTGDRYVNPTTGSVWLYEGKGWRRVL